MKTVIRILAGVVLAVLLFGLPALLFIQQSGPAYVQKRLAEKVRTATKGRYQLSIDSLELDPWTVSVRLVNLRFGRDTLVDSLSGMHVLDEYDVLAELGELELKDFGLLNLWMGGELLLDRLRLSRPSILIRKNVRYDAGRAVEGTVTADSVEYTTFSDSAARQIPAIEIGSFSLEDASFAFYDGKNESPELMIRGLSAGLTGFHSKRYQPFLSASPLIRVDTASALVSKGIARMTLTGLRLTDTLLHLDSIHYGHVVNPYRINAIKGFRANWLDVQGRDLDVRGIDYQLAAADSALVIRRIDLGEFNLVLFKDKADTRINPVEKELPSTLIRDIPIPLFIDTVRLNRGFLDIQMQAEAGNTPGRLVIGGINAHIRNLTNMPDRLARDPFLDLHIRARMMNQGPVDLKGKFDIESPEDYYEMTATVGKMPLASLNNFLGSQFFFGFASGDLQNMHLEYTGNNRYTKGKMDLEYNNLKIQKLTNFKKFRKTRAKNGFLLMLGNWIIPKNRSGSQRGYKTGLVYYEKPLNRDVVHVLVQSMLSGVISNFGFGPGSMEKVEKKAAKVKRKEQKVER